MVPTGTGEYATDFVMHFDAIPDTLGRNAAPTKFTVHVMVPLQYTKSVKTQDAHLAMTISSKGAPPKYLDMSTPTSRNNANADESGRKMTLINGDLTCITLTASTGAKLADDEHPSIAVKSAHITTNSGANIPVVSNGKMLVGFAMHSHARLKTDSTGETKMCYKPSIGNQGALTLDWTATTHTGMKATARAAATPKIEVPPYLWCIFDDIPCNGTVVLNNVVMCAEGEVYDPVLGECVLVSGDVSTAITVVFAVAVSLMLIGALAAIVYGLRGHTW